MNTPMPTHANFTDYCGRKFGRWTVNSYAGKRGSNPIWNCTCDCGVTKVVLSSSFLTGASISCGCVRREQLAARMTIHGHSKRSGRSPEYRTWKNMISRCHGPANHNTKHYGDLGIKVCERWRDSFAAFLADVGERPSRKYTIERNDNARDYEPGNVRWATRAEQARNKRNNRWLTLHGETLCLADWAKRIGISKDGLSKRLARGLTVEQALDNS